MEWLISRKQPLIVTLRWFILLIAGMLVGIFLNALTHSTSVYAVDAEWSGHNLTYNKEKYTKVSDDKKIKQFNLPDNSLVYVNEDKNKKETKVIYFPSSEISSLSSATYVVYSFTPPNTYEQASNSTISIESPSENSTGTSCDVQGIGWIICPLSNWLADGIDYMYSALQEFLKTKPLETTNQNSGIYLAWVIMRNISNVAFIVAFLVIIYSQLTSVGISNYGVKKMLPRLVIAAVLVNLSFTICAILLDLSNIAGYAFQDAFMGIKNTISTVGENTSTWTWSEVISTALSNGALAVGAGYAVSLALTTELLPMLVPAATLAGLTLLFILLIMAARQALIIILIIVSPLAFVCYLLPGTEKWFKKWRDSFLTMLVFFPAFAVVFGGAQLAGIIIIQNASGSNGAIMHILGMLVQIIPLAITPLIMKFSGGVLGKFAGFVNDKNKGLYDRSKNWSKDRRETIKNKKLANPNMARFNPNRLRRWADHNSRLRKKDLETSQKDAENSFRNTAKYKKSDLYARQASRRSDFLSAQDDNRYLESTLGHAPDDIYEKRSLYDRALRNVSATYATRQDLKAHQQQTAFMNDIKDLETEIATAGLIKNNAQRQQHSEFAEQLKNSKELQEKAGGNVFKDANGNLIGANAALASAIATSRSEYAKSVDEAHQIMKNYKLSAGQRQKISLGNSVTLSDGTVLDSNNIFIREAAIEEQIKYGTVTEVAQLVSELPPEFYSSVSAALASSGVKNKASFMGGKLIDDMVKGAINNRQDLLNYCADWLQGGKYKPETLATTEADGVKLLMEAVKNTSVITDKKRQDLKKVINTILTDKRLSANATDATKEQFEIFRNML
ncbi:type IV secretion system protein [Candidatus Nanosynbacter sp. TM7-057]|uniref:type IV secretion system protein n=1 Tax=Candidatus Nanosynbacter sp. TM7-057 TaxID=2902630 RepID=UPI001FB779A7|nr:type IV secretion system protein [Candidatus Nanosynbacter sp. TM7-057]MCJ1964753.1 type IV secretion system protein [Candidatus Nanosynbacter sp. TM7-057]